MKTKKRREFVPYLFIAPWIIGFLVFTIGPLIFSLIMSFFNWPVIGEPNFVGLGNYEYGDRSVSGNAHQPASKRRQGFQDDLLYADGHLRRGNFNYMGMDTQ